MSVRLDREASVLKSLINNIGLLEREGKPMMHCEKEIELDNTDAEQRKTGIIKVTELTCTYMADFYSTIYFSILGIQISDKVRLCDWMEDSLSVEDAQETLVSKSVILSSVAYKLHLMYKDNLEIPEVVMVYNDNGYAWYRTAMFKTYYTKDNITEDGDFIEYIESKQGKRIFKAISNNNLLMNSLFAHSVNDITTKSLIQLFILAKNSRIKESSIESEILYSYQIFNTIVLNSISDEILGLSLIDRVDIYLEYLNTPDNFKLVQSGNNNTERPGYSIYELEPSEKVTHKDRLNKLSIEVSDAGRNYFDTLFNISTLNNTITLDDLDVIGTIIMDDARHKETKKDSTPVEIVREVHKVIQAGTGLGAEVYSDNSIFFWDMTWGTGNMTKDYKMDNLICSTLNQSDIDECILYNQGAEKFQYDFLNDDSDFIGKFLNLVETLQVQIDLIYSQDEENKEQLLEVAKELLYNELKGSNLYKKSYKLVDNLFDAEKTPIILAALPSVQMSKDKSSLEDNSYNQKLKQYLTQKKLLSKDKYIYEEFLYLMTLIKKYINPNTTLAVIVPKHFLQDITISSLREFILKEFEIQAGIVYSSKEIRNTLDIESDNDNSDRVFLYLSPLDDEQQYNLGGDASKIPVLHRATLVTEKSEGDTQCNKRIHYIDEVIKPISDKDTLKNQLKHSISLAEYKVVYLHRADGEEDITGRKIKVPLETMGYLNVPILAKQSKDSASASSSSGFGASVSIADYAMVNCDNYPITLDNLFKISIAYVIYSLYGIGDYRKPSLKAKEQREIEQNALVYMLFSTNNLVMSTVVDSCKYPEDNMDFIRQNPHSNKFYIGLNETSTKDNISALGYLDSKLLWDESVRVIQTARELEQLVKPYIKQYSKYNPNSYIESPDLGWIQLRWIIEDIKDCIEIRNKYRVFNHYYSQLVTRLKEQSTLKP